MKSLKETDWGFEEYLIHRCIKNKNTLSTPQEGRLLANPTVPYVPPLADEAFLQIKTRFLTSIVQGSYPIEQLPVVGYTEHEIAMLEAAYDFEARGELRDYLRVMGRDQGGICYDSEHTKSVTNILLSIKWCKEILSEYDGEHLMNGVFLLYLTDTDHYFLPTRVKGEAHIVHCASENNELVKSQNETLIQSLRREFEFRLQNGLVQQHKAKTVRRLF